MFFLCMLLVCASGGPLRLTGGDGGLISVDGRTDGVSRRGYGCYWEDRLAGGGLFWVHGVVTVAALH